MEAQKQQPKFEKYPPKAIAQSLLLTGLLTALLIWAADLLFSNAGASTLVIYKGLQEPFEFLRMPKFTLVVFMAMIATLLLWFAWLGTQNMWSHFKSQRAWVLFLFIGLGLYCIAAAFRSTTFEYLGAFLILGSTAALMWPDAIERTNTNEDQLHRSFFANRIVQMLTSEKPVLRRIAILAPWGQGKTFLLRLIETKLNATAKTSCAKSPLTIKTKWINPWKASTKEEAWKIIASAFDSAVGTKPLLPIIRKSLLSTKSLSSITPATKIGHQVLQAISSHFPDEAKADLIKIDQALEKRDIRLVIFIDDMERSEPEVIRGILPVIDKLTGLKHCFFLFGIDRERIEDAFLHLNVGNHTTPTDRPEANKSESVLRSKSYVSGYLDKVMDLQLELPECSNLEITKWAKSEIAKHEDEIPKLESAFPSLKPYLPSSPRICKKFLDLAFHAELFYLSHYRSDERNFLAVFLVLLGEAEFPGYRIELARDLSWSVMQWTEFIEKTNGDSNTSSSKEDQHTAKICNALGISSTIGHTRFEKIKSLTAAISKHVGDSGIWGPKPESAQWAVSDFLTRHHLSENEMDEVAKAWYTNSKTKPINEIITTITGTQNAPSDLATTIYQILQHEIRKTQIQLQKLRQLSPKSHEAKEPLNAATRFFKTVKKHFDTELSLDEQDAIDFVEEGNNDINPRIFGGLFSLIEALPIEPAAEDDFSDLRKLRISAIIAVAKSISLGAKGRLLYRMQMGDHLDFDGEVPRQASKNELSEVTSAYKTHLAPLFSELLSKQDYLIFASALQSKDQTPFVLYEPEMWLPSDGDNFNLDAITELADQVSSNQLLANNVSTITRRLFLQQTLTYSDRSSPELYFNSRKLMCKSKKHRKYVKAFWELSMRNADNSTREELLRLREEARTNARLEENKSKVEPNQYNAETPFMTPDIIDACFPLPS